MSVRNVPTIEDRDPIRMVSTIRQLVAGRSNAVGTFTLGPGASVTVVDFVNCGEDSQIFLSPRTANAAAALASTYVSAVLNGSFTITHTNNSQTDRTFGFEVRG